MLIHSQLPYDHSTSHARVPAGGINLIASIDSANEAQFTASFFGSTNALHGENAIPSAETSTHNHSNQQYSITAVTTSTGAVAERYAYSAYGEPTILDGSGSTLSNSAINNRYSYTGREWDATVGLHHFRARWMSPKTGRFLGRDPIAYMGSEWNLYQFVDAMALSSLDPTGLRQQGRGTRGLDPRLDPNYIDPWRGVKDWWNQPSRPRQPPGYTTPGGWVNPSTPGSTGPGPATPYPLPPSIPGNWAPLPFVPTPLHPGQPSPPSSPLPSIPPSIPPLPQPTSPSRSQLLCRRCYCCCEMTVDPKNPQWDDLVFFGIKSPLGCAALGVFMSTNCRCTDGEDCVTSLNPLGPFK
jgi:RHS repeat-associated protein